MRGGSLKEIETKIVDIDERGLRASLKSRGARHEGITKFRRYVFDMHPNKRADSYDEFVRIRTDGRNSTLTYKFRSGTGLANTEEVEVAVSDFGAAHDIVSKLWKGAKPYYQENTIDAWRYKGAEISIVKWPGVRPYVEVEAKSERGVRRAIAEIGIKGTELGNTNLVRIFELSGMGGRDTGDLRF